MNAVFPILLLIVLGYHAKRAGMLSDRTIAQINRFGGNISKTAEFIGMERSAVHRKLKSLGV